MPNSDFRTIGRWMLVFTVLAALSLTAVLTVGRQSMRMSSAMAAASDASGFAELSPGSTAQAVVEITRVGAKGSTEGKLLEREREDLYRRTATVVGISFNDATPVVMGKLGDVHARAVVHVKGTIGNDHRITAEQIVILTGYVKVE
ncbi:MAG: hypothetical protein WBS19_07935 [Candidatus Korobacteraceae bacterium]